MKSGVKKVIASLCLIAVVVFSAIFTTGCSNGVELTQEQLNKLIETVENGNNYMNESLDVMKNDNQLSQTQTDELLSWLEENKEFMEESVDVLKQNNEQQKYEKAWRMFNSARLKMMFNKDGILDNMVMNMDYELNGDEQNVTAYCYNLNGQMVFIEVIEDNNINGLDFNRCVIEIDNGVNGIFNNSYSGSEYYLSQENVSFLSYLGVDSFTNIYSIQLEYADLCNVEVMENGNYNLSFVKIVPCDEAATDVTGFLNTLYYLNYEMTADGKILSYEQNEVGYGNVNFNGMCGGEINTVKVTYEYNIITDTTFIEETVEYTKSKFEETQE